MKKLFLILVLGLILNSCSNYLAERQRKKLEEKRIAYEYQLRSDKTTCSNYGYTSGTSEFSDCLMKLDFERRAELRRQKAEECRAVRQSNSQSVATGLWGGILMGARENLACE